MFETKNLNTWCSGCPNFMIKKAIEIALTNLINAGEKKENFVAVTDIGCNSKIYDYLNISGFYGLHGRTLPVALGIKIGNPKLKVICFGGDGGTYGEGAGHFVHACRNNTDFTILVHNNQVFSLTTGQATPTTETGFVEKTHPFGVKERPLNPLVLALETGATFVARVSALDIALMAEVFEEAIKHPGFAVVDILQPCLVYHDSSKFLSENTYKVKPKSFEEAVKEAKKWDHSSSGKVGIGIFYQEQRKTFEENYLGER